MRLHYILPWVSCVCFIAATIHVSVRRDSQDLKAPPIESLVSPFEESIAACGIVESQTEDVEVSSTVSGVVCQVTVVEGDCVKAGQPLFRLDDRQLQAELQIRQAELRLAESELAALANQPRPEEVVIAEARQRNAEACLLDAQDEAGRMSRLSQNRAVAHRDVVHAERLEEVAQAVLDERRAELQLLRSGAWEFEQDVKRQQVQCAAAQCRKMEVEIERLQTTAPIDAEVLQVNVRPGEFISVPPETPPVVLGDTRNLHVRVEIDEFEIDRFEPNARAVAAPCGSGQGVVRLKFVRVEPYVVPKQWVSGYQHQIIDTRVLQVVYCIEPRGSHAIYVGQQVDVYIDASEPSSPRSKTRGPQPNDS